MTICLSPQCQSTAGCICGTRWPVAASQPSHGFTFTHEPGCPYLTAAGGMGQCTCTPEQKEIKRLKASLAFANGLIGALVELVQQIANGPLPNAAIGYGPEDTVTAWRAIARALLVKCAPEQNQENPEPTTSVGET